MKVLLIPILIYMWFSNTSNRCFQGYQVKYHNLHFLYDVFYLPNTFKPLLISVSKFIYLKLSNNIETSHNVFVCTKKVLHSK